jgi:peroxiredoxin
MFGLSEYNYRRFRRGSVVNFAEAPEPGEEAPDFELPSTGGQQFKLSDYKGKKNVVLTFGSATCPQTAASIDGLKDLAEEFAGKGVQFLFVYGREAHPGEQMPAHRAIEDKIDAARILEDEEELDFPVLVDELNGRVHRKYGTLPNATFIIDRSGRIAFRSLASRPEPLGEALEELLDRQSERGLDHNIVCGGEDTTIPSLRRFVRVYQALERGGDASISNFRREMGMPGRMAVMGGRIVGPVTEHPYATLAAIAAVAGVVGLGIWVGTEIRRRRMEDLPYRYTDVYEKRPRGEEPDDYEAVGI